MKLKITELRPIITDFAKKTLDINGFRIVSVVPNESKHQWFVLIVYNADTKISVTLNGNKEEVAMNAAKSILLIIDDNTGDVITYSELP